MARASTNQPTRFDLRRDANDGFASLTPMEMPRKRDASGLRNGEAVRDMRDDTLEEGILTWCASESDNF